MATLHVLVEEAPAQREFFLTIWKSAYGEHNRRVVCQAHDFAERHWKFAQWLRAGQDVVLLHIGELEQNGLELLLELQAKNEVKVQITRVTQITL